MDTVKLKKAEKILKKTYNTLGLELQYTVDDRFLTIQGQKLHVKLESGWGAIFDMTATYSSQGEFSLVLSERKLSASKLTASALTRCALNIGTWKPGVNGGVFTLSLHIFKTQPKALAETIAFTYGLLGRDTALSKLYSELIRLNN